ncbi:hypothetical protein EJC49_17105 [Aquibium carbonis]|uniref:Uncharacterized protein n=1 Tax=Aquibium carbonis TaxID=2495581 RepID=A0A429YV26_9HYPH|nr:hypothetical protein [Aquibium carbonis]RST85194.1 hypothetical protein EJC49_17105 [Aquibium carbonis]
MLPPLHLAFDESSTPHDIRVRMSAGGRLVGTIFFRCESTPLVMTADTLLCLGLTPALEVHAPLRVEGTVEASLIANAAAIQEMLCSWYPAYRPIPVTAEVGSQTYPEGRGTGLFFSGGVDSSYSLASEKNRLDALITMVDAKTPGQRGPGAQRLVDGLARAASTLRLEPIFVETNIRAMMQPFLGWIEFHGSAMAAIRHLLGDRFHTVLIASSGDETAWFEPWGSHPGLDPLLGTPDARIEHHGLVKRFDKVRTILTEPVLMDGLHVCNTDPKKNCGQCSKCRFVMACLSVLDATEEAPSFPRDREYTPFRFKIEDAAVRSEYVYLRERAAATGRHARLIADIDASIAACKLPEKRRSVVATADPGWRLRRLKHRARYWRASR